MTTIFIATIFQTKKQISGSFTVLSKTFYWIISRISTTHQASCLLLIKIHCILILLTVYLPYIFQSKSTVWIGLVISTNQLHCVRNLRLPTSHPANLPMPVIVGTNIWEANFVNFIKGYLNCGYYTISIICRLIRRSCFLLLCNNKWYLNGNDIQYGLLWNFALKNYHLSFIIPILETGCY